MPLLQGAEYSLMTTGPLMGRQPKDGKPLEVAVLGGRVVREETPDEVVRHVRNILAS